MDALEKRAFIIGLLEDVKQTMLKQVDSMPEHWDGHELRRLMTERFKQHVDSPTIMKGSTRRGMEYKEAVIRHNLL